MRHNLQRCLFLLIVLSAFSVSASAIPILWTFSGVTLSDGATVTGSFDYDADTAAFSNVDVIISGSAAPVLNGIMLFDVPAFSTATYFEASTALPAVVGTTAAIYTRFSSAMTDAGGAIPILLSFDSYEGVCQAVDCTVFTPPLDAVAAGEISAPTSIAPEPEPWATLVLGLIGLAALKLRHRSTRG